MSDLAPASRADMDGTDEDPTRCEAELGIRSSLAQCVEYQVKRRVGVATSLNAVWPVQERLRVRMRQGRHWIES